RAARMAPLTAREADDLIRVPRLSAPLLGHPARPAGDLAGLREVLLRLSRLAADHPEITELDLNPTIVRPDGGVAVDARVRLAPRRAWDPYLRRLRRTMPGERHRPRTAARTAEPGADPRDPPPLLRRDPGTGDRGQPGLGALPAPPARNHAGRAASHSHRDRHVRDERRSAGAAAAAAQGTGHRRPGPVGTRGGPAAGRLRAEPGPATRGTVPHPPADRPAPAPAGAAAAAQGPGHRRPGPVGARGGPAAGRLRAEPGPATRGTVPHPPADRPARAPAGAAAVGRGRAGVHRRDARAGVGDPRRHPGQ